MAKILDELNDDIIYTQDYIEMMLDKQTEDNIYIRELAMREGWGGDEY